MLTGGPCPVIGDNHELIPTLMFEQTGENYPANSEPIADGLELSGYTNNNHQGGLT